MFLNFKESLFEDPDFKEDSVREVIISPILSRLGYLPSGQSKVIRSKTLKHPFIRVGTRKHPVRIIPDYTLIYKEKPVFILDAKSPKENILNQAHVQQAYSYAIHPEIKCREFGLCNGKHLAVFDTDHDDPILFLKFDEFEKCWKKIEKHLSPKYLLEPALRNFAPDLGYKFHRIGIEQNTDLMMLGVQLNLFGRVSDELFTAGANCEFAEIDHCVSFDFSPTLLTQILEGLPFELSRQFREALNRAPFQASAGLTIELDLTAHLGEVTKGKYEKFIPLIIQKIHESRFNPTPTVDEPHDIPEDVFQLRKAFKVRE